MVETGSWVYVGAIASLCACIAPSRTDRSEPQQEANPALVEAFTDAADRTNVPFELLAAIAYVETRYQAHEVDLGDNHHAPSQVGVMALTVDEARRGGVLAGVGSIAPLSDDAANVAAAAAILAELAGDPVRSPGASIDEWHPVLTAHRGEAFADQVFETMARGFASRDFTVTARADLGGWEREIAIPTAGSPQGYPGAIWSPAHSSNYNAASRTAADIDYIVVHTTQGSYGGTISWFKNSSSNVSSHYVVRSSDGEVTQMVDDSDIAWHDACFNTPTVGIEHEGFVDAPETWYTESMYMASAQLTAYLSAAYDIPIDRQHIYGHGDAPDCSDHSDPGPGWDWGRYLALARSEGRPELGAAYVAQEFPQVMRPGEEAVVWFELDNLSNITWGLDETRLGTTEPADRESPFFVEGNWMSPTRATGADHSNYGPGDRGRFTFLIRAPEVDEPTVFTESFQLVQDTPDGDEWFGEVVTATIEVVPDGWTDPGEGNGGDGDGDGEAGGDPSGGCQVGGGPGAGSLLLLLALVALVRRRRDW